MTHPKRSQERIGELLIISEVSFFSLFPLILTNGVEEMSRIMFLGISNLIAAVCLFIYLLVKNKFHELSICKAWPDILKVTVFILIIPSVFLSLGAERTDGITVSIFHQAELFFTFIICGILFNEPITKDKLLGALITLTGATIILYQGGIDFNLGVLFIVIGTFFYPFGNISAKRAMKLVSPGTILFVRALLGGLALILISFFAEERTTTITENILSHNNLYSLLFTGIVVYFASKFLWYEGIRRIEIGKAVSINLVMPAMSVIFSILFFRIFPTNVQLIGMVLTAIGLYFITRKKQDPKFNVE